MSQRNSRTRSVGLILVGLMLGAVTIAPAFANHTPNHTAKQIKRLNKKVKKVNAGLSGQVVALQAEVAKVASEVTPFSQTVAKGSTATLIQHGPLTIKGSCVDDAGGTATLVYIETTENGTAFGGDDDSSGDIGPATPQADREIESFGATTAAGPDHSDGYDDQFSAIAPSGPALHGTVSSIANHSTLSCKFYGSWTKIA